MILSAHCYLVACWPKFANPEDNFSLLTLYFMMVIGRWDNRMVILIMEQSINLLDFPNN